MDDTSETKGCCQKILGVLKKELFLVITVIVVILGIVGGFLGRYGDPSDEVIMFVSFPGDLFMRMLKMLILPLIASSLISGLARLDASSSGKIGKRALIYYLTTTCVATVIGICCVFAIRPGSVGKMSETDSEEEKNVSTVDAILDLIRNLIPDNLVKACVERSHTVYIPDTTNSTKLVRRIEYQDGMNVLGIIGFCIVFGVTMGKMKTQVKVVIDFFNGLNDIIMNMVYLVMWYSPFGIISLIAGRIMIEDDLVGTLSQLGLYMMTCFTGMLIHFLGTICLMYFVITRKNPFKFFMGMFQAWVTALATASSSATMPITLRCLEENNKIDRRISRFVIPVGATINMDGTALYEAVAAIFIAQMNGIQLSVLEVVTISLTSTLASIGAASIPSAGLVTMLLVFSAVGLPHHDIILILPVDWLVDRVRTSLNVLGDAYGAAIVSHLSRQELEDQDREAIGSQEALAKLKNLRQKLEKRQESESST